MRTELGKELRKLRAEHDETMSTMAKKIGKTASFLSAVEIGKKEPPSTLEEAIITLYNLAGETAERLRVAADRSRKAFTLQPKDAFARDTAALMARKMDGLSQNQLLDIQSILRNKEGK